MGSLTGKCLTETVIDAKLLRLARGRYRPSLILIKEVRRFHKSSERIEGGQ